MATLVEKRIDLNKFEIIKYQLIQHCFVNKIWLNETELNCLSFLGECGQLRVTEFCKLAVEKGIQNHPIAVNNVLTKLKDKNLVIKQKSGKKIIFLNPALNIQSEGNIVINIKLVKLEGKKTSGNISDNSKKVEFA